jgi:hypothetical protein
MADNLRIESLGERRFLLTRCETDELVEIQVYADPDAVHRIGLDERDGVDEQRIVRAAADFLLERQGASPRSQAPSTGESPAETCRRATAASNPGRQTRFSCSKRGWTAATCASGEHRVSAPATAGPCDRRRARCYRAGREGRRAARRPPPRSRVRIRDHRRG